MYPALKVTIFKSHHFRQVSATSVRAVFGVTVLFTLVLFAVGDVEIRAQKRAFLQEFAEQSAVLALESGKTVTRDFVPNEVHRYAFSLRASQYVLIEADQRGIDLSLSVFDPSSKKILEADMFQPGEKESVFLVAETEGNYRVEVRPSYKSASKGGYELQIKTLRPSTEQDLNDFAAEKLVAEAMQVEHPLTAAARQKAIEKYEQSISFWKAAKDASWQARTLCLIASDYISLGEKQKAFALTDEALPIAESLVKQAGGAEQGARIKVKAYVLDVVGRTQQEFGDKKKAIEFYDEAILLSRSIDDRAGEVKSLINMGRAYQLMGDYPKALELAQRARLMVEELGDRRKEGTVLNNICLAYQSTGEYAKGLDSCNQALATMRGTNDRWGEAAALNNLGNIYYSLGDYQKTLDFYGQANEIFKELGNGRGQGIALNNIGWLYATLGDLQKSIDVYTRALELFRSQNDQYREAGVLNNIGVNYSNMSDYRKALEIHLQVLPLRDITRNRDGKAITLENIAECYNHLGNKEKALDYYSQSLTLFRLGGDPRLIATTLKNIGALYRDMGDVTKSLESLNEALLITRRVGDKFNEATALAEIARVERDRDNLAEARKLIEQALSAVESLRTNVKSQQLRASFMASVQEYFEFDVDVLMRLHLQHPLDGYDAAALAASEKGRARSLLELLAESRAEIREGVDSSLLKREKELRELIADKAEGQIRLLSGQHTEESANKAAREIDALTIEYEEVLARIRETSPRYAALMEPTPLSLKEIQDKVLDDETLLLEYSLGANKSFLWAVTPTSVTTFELPKRQAIEAAARHLYQVVTERNRAVNNETPLQQRSRLSRSDDEYQKTALVLSNMLLRPVASQLRGKRLLFVGDGILQYVPFAALPTPREDKEPTANGVAGDVWHRPLILDHEIINLPSASVMAVLRQETINRERAPKTLAVLADPVFQMDDPRINAGNKAKQEEPSAEAYRSAKESGLEGFVRLRFTRHEADEITRLAPTDRRFEALDFEASRANATSALLGQYQIVHFATHGIMADQVGAGGVPGLVLSPPTRKGQCLGS